MVKVTSDGVVVIKTDKDAREALEAFQRLKVEIDELKEESGLNDLEKDAVAYKAAAQNYMIAKKRDQIQCKGFHGTLVKGYYQSHFVATEDEIAEGDPEGVIPLQKIIEKKFKSKIKDKGSKARKIWMRITKRVVDFSAIDELVAEGVLAVDEIAPAWVEKEKAPYLRLFDDD